MPKSVTAADRLFTGSQSLARLIVMHAGLVPKAESALETERLAALIYGLALRASLHPDQLPPALARTVVRRHLRQLSKA